MEQNMQVARTDETNIIDSSRHRYLKALFLLILIVRLKISPYFDTDVEMTPESLSIILRLSYDFHMIFI